MEKMKYNKECTRLWKASQNLTVFLLVHDHEGIHFPVMLNLVFWKSTVFQADRLLFINPWKTIEDSFYKKKDCFYHFFNFLYFQWGTKVAELDFFWNLVLSFFNKKKKILSQSDNKRLLNLEQGVISCVGNPDFPRIRLKQTHVMSSNLKTSSLKLSTHFSGCMFPWDSSRFVVFWEHAQLSPSPAPSETSAGWGGWPPVAASFTLMGIK